MYSSLVEDYLNRPSDPNTKLRQNQTVYLQHRYSLHLFILHALCPNLTIYILMTVRVTNLKGFNRKWPWPILRYWPGSCLKGLRKTTKNLNETSRFSGQDLKAQIPDYKSGLPTTLLQISMPLYYRKYHSLRHRT